MTKKEMQKIENETVENAWKRLRKFGLKDAKRSRDSTTVKRGYIR